MASYSGVASSGLLAPIPTTLSDLFANFKYESTIGLLYLNKKKADIADVTDFLLKINVDVTDIVGVQRDTEKWFSRLLVKFENYAKSEFERVKEMDGQIINLKNGEIKIRIQDMTTEYKYVNVAGIPFEVPDNVVVDLFSRFGEVKEVRMNFYNVGLKGLATGTRKIKMIVKRNIPSVLKVGSKTINIVYEGQTRTCYKCGLDTHMGGSCSTEKDDFVHHINDTDYPILPQQGLNQPHRGEKQQEQGNQQPDLDDQQSVSGDPHPVTGEQQPDMGDQQPVMGDQQPVSSVSGDQQPVPGDQQPVMGDQQPVMEDQQPVSGDQQLVSGDQQPVLGDQQPVLGDQKTVSGDQQPVSGDQQQGLGEQQPCLGDPQHMQEEQMIVQEEQ